MNKIENSIDKENEVKPVVVLPGNEIKYSDTAKDLSRIYRDNPVNEKLFMRGGKVHLIEHERTTGELYLQVLTPSRAKSEFERVAVLVKSVRKTVSGEYVYEKVRDVCSDTVARGILDSRDFRENLPPINIITRCPVLIHREDGRCDAVSGYDELTGILAQGKPVREAPLEEASKLIHGLLADYDFQTESDRSRAMANIITPALVFGGIMKTRIPIGMVGADQSQAGKGFFNRIITTMYNEKATTVSQRKGGVGGFDESFDTALVKGRPFITLDNLRGKLDSPHLEAFLTEPTHQARIPHCGSMDIDPTRYVILATSNQFEMTKDLANRANMVRIRKRPMDYNYRKFPEGNLLAHLETNQPLYLGAVYAVVSEWCRRGKPTTDEGRHDFRDWAKALDWIVQNLLGCAPLMDGHQEAQHCTVSPEFQWLKEVCSAIKRIGYFGKEMPTHMIASACSDEGVELPASDGCKYDELEEPEQKQVCRQIGKRFSNIFRQSGTAEGILRFGEFLIQKKTCKTRYESGKIADSNLYSFSAC